MKDSTMAVIGGGLFLAGVATIWLSLRNCGMTGDAGKTICKTIEKPVTKAQSGDKLAEAVAEAARHVSGEPFDVCSHLRTLGDGRHASAEKIASALENGFVLGEKQTWVVGYPKSLKK